MKTLINGVEALWTPETIREWDEQAHLYAGKIVVSSDRVTKNRFATGKDLMRYCVTTHSFTYLELNGDQGVIILRQENNPA